MAFFLRSGNTYRVSSKEEMDLHEMLPPGNYVIKQDAFGNLFLEVIDAFEIPVKLYGDTLKHTNRILTTFEDRTASTGVLLNGEKGSGKTLLAKNLAFESAKKGIPTIVINAPWSGDKFNSLLQSIEQPCVVLFDEFEKVYPSQAQEGMLTLLDGVFPSKKLFVLTCNDKWRVDSHMRNRPGRIFYMIDFQGLPASFIREYCEDNLKNKIHIDRVVQISATFSQFNFDMLKALIEEMNRFDESPQESMGILNTRPEFSGEIQFNVTLSFGGKEFPGDNIDSSEWKGNPLTAELSIGRKVMKKAEDEGDKDYEDWEYEDFVPADLKKIDGDNGIYVFVNENGYSVVLTRVKPKVSRYWDAF